MEGFSLAFNTLFQVYALDFPQEIQSIRQDDMENEA